MNIKFDASFNTTKGRILLAPILHLVVPFIFFIPMLYFGFTPTAFIVSYIVSRWIAGQITNMFLTEFIISFAYTHKLYNKED